MNTGLVSTRYAHALYDFAKKNKAEDQVYTQSKLMSKSFNEFIQLKSVLNNPVMGNLKKKEIILLSMGNEVNPVFEKFIDLLLANNREELLQNIALTYIDFYRKTKDIYAAKLTTAIKIDNETEKRLIKVIENRTNGTLELEKILNPDILGGFLLEVDNMRWDATISGQLSTIKRSLLE